MSATGAGGLNLDEIEARANAATVGPWRADVLGSEGYAVTGPQGSAKGGHPRRVPRVARCGHEDWDTDRANAEHIAGMDPTTTLALVAEVRALRAKVETARALHVKSEDDERLDWAFVPDADGFEVHFDVCNVCGGDRAPEEWPCETIRALDWNA